LSSRASVTPLKGIAPYVGGKRVLASRLVDIIDRIPHETYAEPFVGMGGVFFRRQRVPKAEVVNDLSGDVATLFRVLQRHYLAFVEMLRWQLTTRAEFERLVATDPDNAHRSGAGGAVLLSADHGIRGKVAGRNFGVTPDEPGSFDVTRLVPRLEAYHTRLAGVVIERLPYADFIARYDRPGTLFYLDPPYFGSEHYYGKDAFGREDFARLAQQLARIKGRFVMSINEHRDVRAIFGRFRCQKVPVTYSIMGGGKRDRAGELIITGPGKGGRGRSAAGNGRR
jgi:DNA adenine methylase